MNQLELHWLAGILEGEGWFGHHKRFSTYTGALTLHPILSVKMVDSDIINRVHELVGAGSITKQELPSGKIAYCFQVSGKNAILLMIKLQPLMGVRRSAKILEITQHWFTTREPADA